MRWQQMQRVAPVCSFMPSVPGIRATVKLSTSGWGVREGEVRWGGVGGLLIILKTSISFPTST